MYLQTLKDEIMENPDTPRRVTFSRAQVEAARTAFSRMVRRGEMRLHRLCELTGDDIFDRNYARQSVVIGQRGRVLGRMLSTSAVASPPPAARDDLV